MDKQLCINFPVRKTKRQKQKQNKTNRFHSNDKNNSEPGDKNNLKPITTTIDFCTKLAPKGNFLKAATKKERKRGTGSNFPQSRFALSL